MIAQLQASGTLLYPLLGRGFDGSVTSTFASYTSALDGPRMLAIAIDAAGAIESIAALAVVAGGVFAARTAGIGPLRPALVAALWASGIVLVVLSDGAPRFAVLGELDLDHHESAILFDRDQIRVAWP